MAPWGEREGLGGIRSLGLTDANSCFWNGFTMRSCCVALRTMSGYLQHSNERKKYVYLYVQLGPLAVQWEKKSEWSGSSPHGSVVMNPTSIHKDLGSIPGLAEWVKDLALP